MTAPLLPPVYRDCRRLLVHTEEVVRRFARYHKYTVGTDLRRQEAMQAHFVGSVAPSLVPSG